MDFVHHSVLLEETVAWLNPRSGNTYVDATLGGAGHTRLLLERCAPEGRVIAFDQDETAIRHAQEMLREAGNRLTIIHSNFRHIAIELEQRDIHEIDGALFDLGVSSVQFDVAERGFSYQNDGPLDMRMDRRQGATAESFVNEAEQSELAKVFFRFGEEKFSRQIARRIVQVRETTRITSTAQLAQVVKSGIPAAARRTGPHPARRVFQAIRIAVNDELAALSDGLEGAFSLLCAGGRLAVISFHSLEDRIVKHTLKDFATGCICPPDYPVCTCGRSPKGKILTRKPIETSQREVDENPRARSAKLRVIEKVNH